VGEPLHEPLEPLERPVTPPAWLDDLTSSTLHLIAEALVELAGFGAASIGVASDNGLIHTAVVCGSDEAREQLVDHTVPVETLRAVLATGDRWGRFTFVPHERPGTTDLPGWVGRYDMLDVEGAWHPADLLVALLHDGEGKLRGTLAIDIPVDGLRPRPERREVLERFAAQAERAVVSALERARLAHRLRLAESARETIRLASTDLDVALVLERAGDILLGATGTVGLWLRAFTDESATVVASHFAGPPLPRRARTDEVVGRTAPKLWRQQLVGVVYPDAMVNLEDDDNRTLQQYVRDVHAGSALLVPLGVGEECIGSLTLVRAPDAPRWTEAETAYAFDLGADLGQLLFTARAYEREQRLAGDLRALDAYKNRLITTVTQELRRPLSAIADDLDAIGAGPLPVDGRRSLATMARTTRRMVRLVDDLTLLSRVTDPRNELTREPVDLLPIVREVSELTEVAARKRDLTLRVGTPGRTPVVALGNAVELDRVVVNLVNNAVKYTDAGGTITLTVGPAQDPGLVELVVADDGIGISEQDQRQLWTEFFRSTDPAVLARPGTGLGLPIVERIVRRHGGRIEVESQLGHGTTVRVLLPAAS
jgi:signal transduction histidine kinase